MRLDLSTISRLLRSLELQGMVRRTADPDDARACPAPRARHCHDMAEAIVTLNAKHNFIRPHCPAPSRQRSVK